MKLNVLFGVSFTSALYAIFFYAPEEAAQGIVQKIFYIHVASALTMYLGFFISFLTALLYLLEKKQRWDAISASAAEVGFFFCTAVLLTGPIWAKPIWGTWWTWDPRLTTTLLLWLLYAAYLVLRGFFEGSRSKNVSAVMAIVAFLDVPLVHLAVKLWRGIHPSVMSSDKGGIPPSMQLTLFVTFLSTVCLFFVLLRSRYRLENLRQAWLIREIHLMEKL